MSDTEHSEWIFSDGITRNMVMMSDFPYGSGKIWWVDLDNDGMLDGNGMCGNEYDNNFDYNSVKLNCHNPQTDTNDLILYRKYTPGHWEDADGNWINGSWGTWQGGLSDRIEWNNDLVPPAWCNSVEPYTNVECFPSKNDKNANLFIEHDSKSYATRTWNNTKPSA